MEEQLEKELDEILKTDLEQVDVTSKDHYLLLLIGFVPFILASIWYVFQG